MISRPGRTVPVSAIKIQEHRGCPNLRHGYRWFPHEDCLLFVTSNEEDRLRRWRRLSALRGDYELLFMNFSVHWTVQYVYIISKEYDIFLH